MDDERGRPIDVHQISYYQQKEFFRLDKEFEQTFVQSHARKVDKKQKDHLKKGLMAKLLKDRNEMFKKFVTDQS